MKWIIGGLFLALILLSIAIVGGGICLSDGCCYTTPEEIAGAEENLESMVHIWLGLALTNIALIIFSLYRWIKNRSQKRASYKNIEEK